MARYLFHLGEKIISQCLIFLWLWGRSVGWNMFSAVWKEQLGIRAGGLIRGSGACHIAWECGCACDLTLALKTDNKTAPRLAVKALFVLDFVLMVLNLLACHRKSGNQA